MTRFAVVGVVCLIAAAAPAESGMKRTPEGWTVPMRQLGIHPVLESLPAPRDWDVKQVSSYDRSGGNEDASGGHQVYDGGVVLADIEGPGVVSRIWTRNPSGTLYIFIDDIEHPILTMPFKSLFEGGLEYWSPGFNLMGEPFVGESSGGYYSYIPFPFAEHCRIIATPEDDNLAYQVTYVDLPDDTPIQSFDLTLTKDDVRFFKDWQEGWESESLRWPKKDERLHKSRHNYWGHSDSPIFPIEGPGTITELEFRVESADPDILEKVWLSITFDKQEEPSVYAPMGAFFGVTMKGAEDHNTVVLGVEDGRMFCRYPMPFTSYADIRVVNTSDQVADIRYWITWNEDPVDEDYFFSARYAAAETVEGKPYTVADIQGEGHYVGTTIAARGADSLTILEGDDVYLVDGAPADEFHGTGTDDYFNSGWYFAEGAVSRPTHAVTYKAAGQPAAFSAFRSHLTVPVPFKESFVFELEHGPANDRPGVTYESVAYWYQKGESTWSVNSPDPSAKLAKK